MAGVPGDPISSFVGSVGAGLGKGIGDAIGGGSAPLVSGGGWDFRNAFDGSGWTVSTGSSRAQGGSSGGLDNSGQPPALGQSFGLANQAGFGGITAWLMVGLFVAFAARGFKL